MTPAELIRTARLSKGLSQEALAAKCGMARTYLLKIEQGKVEPKLSTLRRLAYALDVPINALIPPNEREG